MKAFTKIEIKGENMARQLYAKLLYPPNTEFIWTIQNNHIKNCEVTFRYIEFSQEIWGNDIDALKGKTTHTKPNLVAGDMLNTPKDLIKLKKTVFLTVGLFFVNGI